MGYLDLNDLSEVTSAMVKHVEPMQIQSLGGGGVCRIDLGNKYSLDMWNSTG